MTDFSRKHFVLLSVCDRIIERPPEVNPAARDRVILVVIGEFDPSEPVFGQPRSKGKCLSWIMNVPELLQKIARPRFSRSEIELRQSQIGRNLLKNSRVMDAANFTQFHPDDLRQLFDMYDELFFGGECRAMLRDSPLKFRISSRMTSAGGTTARRIYRSNPTVPHFEITISSTLLFQTFRDVKRVVTVTGVECRSRLEALQRIFEHEMVHLIEMLLWQRSQCSQARFQGIALRTFGHTDHQHALVTPRERASKQFGLKPGIRVSFQMDGKKYTGMINRITKRATVLVEDAKGRLFSDGRRYTTFYVPLEMLTRIR